MPLSISHPALHSGRQLLLNICLQEDRKRKGRLFRSADISHEKHTHSPHPLTIVSARLEYLPGSRVRNIQTNGKGERADCSPSCAEGQRLTVRDTQKLGPQGNRPAKH